MRSTRYVLTVVTLVAATVTIAGCRRDEEPPGVPPAGGFVRLMNLGKAHLENRNSKEAIGVLRKAVRQRPRSAPAQRNLARAYRLARQPQPALRTLEEAARIESGSAATAYLLGLTLTELSRVEEAIAHFETAVRLDPHTAALRFQLAGAYQAIGKHDETAEQLAETVRLDPFHAAAHFKLATYARRRRDRVALEKHTREFSRLRKLFGDETRSTAALEQCVHTSPEPAAPGSRPARPPVIEVRFADVSDTVFVSDADRAGTCAAVLDVDDSGRCILFVCDAEGRTALLSMSPAGTFRRTPLDLKLPAPAAFHQCLVGDFHNDVPAGVKYNPKVHALSDVLLSGPSGVRLLKQDGVGSFRDVTEIAGLGDVTSNTARWVDYEHDGDLDLLFARPTGLELWQNNGDGRFQNVTTDVGIGDTGAVLHAVAVDLDADLAVDIIVARGAQPTLVFENQRAGRFEAMPQPPGPWPAARFVLADDIDNDGYADAVLVADKEAAVLPGRRASHQRIGLADIDAAAATLLDYDNDGWLDFCIVGTKSAATGEGAVRLYRNTGDGGWVDVSGATGLDSITLPALRGVLAFDADVDGDTDLLLLTSDDRMRLLDNDGGHVNGQLKIRLTTIKTNPTGIGTHIELRKDAFWLTRSVSRLPIEIGLAGHRRLDTVQTIWTNGVVHNQIEVSVGPKPLAILEKNVATGSCPFLYAWDGRRFRFVTDLLGNSPIGLPAARDVMLSADPDEIVLIGTADLLPPREGEFVVVVSDEFREVLYLDHVKLIAVDHPAGTELHPTDKLMPPPYPPSEVWTLRSSKKLVRAVGDDGVDRTAALRAIDGVFAPPGRPLPPPYRGMCEPTSLVMDFGAIDVTAPLVLALTGWLQYGDASTNIAMSQDGSLTIVPPTLEIETTDGGWQPVDLLVGMPAGKTKTILCDLGGRLPEGARRLRLTTTFEIRWDRIALLERTPLPAARIHELAPHGAHLDWRGFSEIRQRGPGHPTTPDFDSVFERPAWRTALQGWCTRYGDVLDLVSTRDDRLAVLSSGDALTLRFGAEALPPVPDGMTRTFFFYSVGWDKDGDYNVTDGAAVGPLPTTGRAGGQARFAGRSPPAGDKEDWQVRYNTRWVPRDRFGSVH